MSRYTEDRQGIRGGCTSEVSVDYVLDIIAEVSFCIFLPGMGQIGKGGTRVGLGVDVLEHQRWTGFSRMSLLGYLHNHRLGIFQNREDWCIWLGLFTLQFVWQFGPGLWCGRGERGIIPHRSFEQRWFTFGWITPPPHGVCGRRWGQNARMIEGFSMDLSAGSYSKNLASSWWSGSDLYI
ncbi:hypothetical protein BDBG_16597 [Blastomyces gilchristii SLH14081]|uniref:Uncharacterized protein n=1 Tax=Blastomyces gilchristii (strain SLH14081) TaxID=559298 RepID=A0A179UGF8_BLAGS|nr:uncharacterized protein BDBG_16597 [Blastomyces gilchristii SLH14081]OAT06319.1 hypothetical protein BDBG_16597 [Blastomyces gilchristii SLH14081]